MQTSSDPYIKAGHRLLSLSEENDLQVDFQGWFYLYYRSINIRKAKIGIQTQWATQHTRTPNFSMQVHWTCDQVPEMAQPVHTEAPSLLHRNPGPVPLSRVSAYPPPTSSSSQNPVHPPGACPGSAGSGLAENRGIFSVGYHPGLSLSPIVAEYLLPQWNEKIW